MTYFKRNAKYIGSLEDERLVVIYADGKTKAFTNNCSSNDTWAAVKKLGEELNIPKDEIRNINMEFK